MYVLVERDAGLALRKAGLLRQAAARLRAGYLDRMLARGIAPETRPELGLRALRLTSAPYRHAIGRNLLHLAPADADTGELAGALLGPDPVPARPVAIVSELLADGAGPLYRRAAADELHAVLRQAGAALHDEQPRHLPAVLAPLHRVSTSGVVYMGLPPVRRLAICRPAGLEI